MGKTPIKSFNYIIKILNGLFPLGLLVQTLRDSFYFNCINLAPLMWCTVDMLKVFIHYQVEL